MAETPWQSTFKNEFVVHLMLSPLLLLVCFFESLPIAQHTVASFLDYLRIVPRKALSSSCATVALAQKLACKHVSAQAESNQANYSAFCKHSQKSSASFAGLKSTQKCSLQASHNRETLPLCSTALQNEVHHAIND